MFRRCWKHIASREAISADVGKYLIHIYLVLPTELDQTSTLIFFLALLTPFRCFVNSFVFLLVSLLLGMVDSRRLVFRWGIDGV